MKPRDRLLEHAAVAILVTALIIFVVMGALHVVLTLLG